MAIVITFLLLMLYLIIFINPVYIFIVLLFALLYPYVIAPLLSINLPIVKYSREEKKFIVPEPNAKLILNESAVTIKNLDVLGIRFSQKTNNIRFHETFTNNLVPVVFYKNNKKQQGELEVTIMKKEFIPKELLATGSEFTVIDNGKEIATGKIITVSEK